MKLALVVLALCAGAALLPRSLSAQIQTGNLYGTVVDKQGYPTVLMSAPNPTSSSFAIGGGDPLALRSANIVEMDTDPDDILARGVLLWIETETAPPCPVNGAPVEYGFLIDADRDRSTGVTGPALDVGIDARVTARCEDGRWSSPMGDVKVEGAAPARVEIRTTVGRLPSTSFFWIAYAARGDEIVGLPAPSAPGSGRAGHSAWAVLELSKP